MTPSPHPTGRSARWALAVAAGTTAAAFLVAPAPADAARKPATTTSTTWSYQRLESPARTRVLDSRGAVLATFTDGARTVTVTGPSRTFAEPSSTSATVTTTQWVRLLPQPFTGSVDATWLKARLSDTSADILANAMRFTTGAAQDADYGPLQSDGTRAEGSDFNDYLGQTWTYQTASGTVTDPPEADQLGSLDCSGFTRMVFGHLGGLPLTLDPDGTRLPRRAVQMAASAPGVVTVPDTGAPPASRATLSAGDLLFWDASTNDGTLIDHVGLYLGVDSAGQHRFLSSRKTVNGPTMGDVGGKSVLDGTGLYASTWRSARRL